MKSDDSEQAQAKMHKAVTNPVMTAALLLGGLGMAAAAVHTLLSESRAVPDADPRSNWRRETVRGEITGSPTEDPVGCAFAPRCAFADERCRESAPDLVEVPGGGRREVACHRAEEISLQGVV